MTELIQNFCNRAKASLISVVFLILPSFLYAFDDQIGKALSLSLSTYIQNYGQSFVAVDSFNAEKSQYYFYRADNKLLFSSGEDIYSQYDNRVSVNAYEFFNRKNYRINFTGIFKTQAKGEIIIFGFDSGTSSNKLKINPAIKFGYINSYELRPNFYISYGVSKWFGGSISESPCLDSYDRAYSCRHLVSWSDRKPLISHMKTSYGLRLLYSY